MSRPAGLSLRVQDAGAGAICDDILAALPHWFGFPASVAAYVESAQRGPAVVATLNELFLDGKIEAGVVDQAIKDLGIDADKANPAIS